MTPRSIADSVHNGKHGQGTHCTKMGADKLAEYTPNAPKFICPNCLPKPKSFGFRWKKASLGVHSSCFRPKFDMVSAFYFTLGSSSECISNDRDKS